MSSIEPEKSYTASMNIEITWPDLLKLAANATVEIGGVTLSVKRPVRPFINRGSEDSKDEFVTFALDGADPKAEPLKFKPQT
jgi:hypothetical protein